MTDYTNMISPGQANNAGSSKALYLKQFEGTVLTTYDKKLVMNSNLVMERTIGGGASSYQFIVTGRMAAKYHARGTELTGQLRPRNERVCFVDEPLVSDWFVPKIDDLLKHYDEDVARQAGVSIADAVDRSLIQLAVLAARSAATITTGGYFGGGAITEATLANNAAMWYTKILEAGVTMDEKDVPEEGRYLIVRPVYHSLIKSNKDLLDSDYGGQGNIANGKLSLVNGITLYKSNHVPNSNITAQTGENNTYSGNFTGTVGIFGCKDGIGHLIRQAPKLEDDYKVENQGTIAVISMVRGATILRPECFIEAKTA